MPIGNDDATQGPGPLVTAREPSVKSAKGSESGSIGSLAVNDAVMIVALCWVLLILLWFSVRRYNV